MNNQAYILGLASVGQDVTIWPLAKIVAPDVIRVAPVPTWKGRKSFALPEFDPFWEEVQKLDIVVGMHSGDAGYQRYTNEWEGITDGEMPPKALDPLDFGL